MFAKTVLMVKPDTFGFNSQTSESNSFQHASSLTQNELRKKAVKESENLRQLLVDNGINVLYMYPNAGMELPDAVFPNNWFTTHADGTIIIYPMCSPSRRDEYNPKMIDYLTRNFKVQTLIDLRQSAKDNQFLEGTGSLVFDNANKFLWVAKSIRTDDNLLKNIAQHFSLKPYSFSFCDDLGQLIYHTNVCLSVGQGFMVIADENISDMKERQQVNDLISELNLETIRLTKHQLNYFCGNILQLKNKRNEPVLVMSTTAYKVFQPAQLRQMEKHTSILHADVSTIEATGGGSVRCMLAEIFLEPLKKS